MVVARLSGTYLFFIFGAAVACSGNAPTPRAPGAGDQGIVSHAAFPEDDDAVAPAYDKSELERALASERTAVEAGEKQVADVADASNNLRVALADLAVRRRFVASLEDCQNVGRHCPPRLDDPPWSYDVETAAAPKLDAPLRFDLDDWRKVADELHGRACACRTQVCVDSMAVAIDELSKRPMPEVEADETASASITRARECLFRLNGRR
jgi:hypothetical protein